MDSGMKSIIIGVAFLIVAVGLTVFAEWFSKFRVYSILTGGR